MKSLNENTKKNFFYHFSYEQDYMKYKTKINYCIFYNQFSLLGIRLLKMKKKSLKIMKNNLD